MHSNDNCDESVITHDAPLVEHFQIFDRVLDLGLFGLIKDVDPIILMQYACLRDKLSVLQYASKRNVNFNGLHYNDMTALMLASKNGSNTIVKYLVEKGADVNATNGDKKTAICYAVSGGHLDIVKYLVENKADVNVKEASTSNSLLHLAAKVDNLDLFKYLQGQGLDVNDKSYKDSVLHVACYMGHIRIMEHIIRSGADIKALNRYGNNIFFDALQGGNFKSIMYTYNLKKWNLNAMNHECSGMLHALAFGGNIDALEYFYDKVSFALNARCEVRNIPLHKAAYRGHLDAVKFLIGKGSLIVTKNSYGDLPISSALFSGNDEVFEFFINTTNNNMDVINNRGLSLIHMASELGRLYAVKLLHDKGVSLTTKTKHGLTPLHYAVQNKNYEIVEYICENTKEIYDENLQLENAFHLAASNGDDLLLEYFNERGFNINQVSNVGTPLHHAVVNDRSDVIKYLLRMGANMFAKNKGDVNAVELAVEEGRIEIVKEFLTNNYDINTCRNKMKATLLYRAANRNQLDIVKYLIQEGANVNLKDTNGRGPLFAAVLGNSEDVIRFLIGNKCRTHDLDKDDCSLMHAAASVGNFNIIKLLQKLNLSVTAKSKDTSTPLHYAVENGHVDCVNYLMEQTSKIFTQNSRTETLFHMAAKSGSVDLLKLLHKKKFPINDPSNLGTALHYAVINNNYAAVIYLLSIGANVNVKNKSDKQTPIFYAALIPNTSMIKQLLDKGANLSLKNKKGNTVMEEAIIQNKLKAIKCFVTNGHPLNTKNDKGETLLHRAASSNNNVTAIQYLIGNGLSVNEKSSQGFTPLYFAINNNNYNVIVYLHSIGALLNY